MSQAPFLPCPRRAADSRVPAVPACASSTARALINHPVALNGEEDTIS
jgi:hypothetical protein